MEFIRYQRSQSGYNPNTSHCIYGLDADLILLALGLHEPKISILRESVLINVIKSQKYRRIPLTFMMAQYCRSHSFSLIFLP